MDSKNNENKQIQLTELELAMLKKSIAGEFFPPEATEEERAAMARVIEKADTLMEELDAYDELDESLMVWFLKKYEGQSDK